MTIDESKIDQRRAWRDRSEAWNIAQRILSAKKFNHAQGIIRGMRWATTAPDDDRERVVCFHPDEDTLHASAYQLVLAVRNVDYLSEEDVSETAAELLGDVDSWSIANIRADGFFEGVVEINNAIVSGAIEMNNPSVDTARTAHRHILM